MIDLDHLDSLHQSATTPGPWESSANAAWIVALHAAWPAISEELKQIRKWKEAAIQAAIDSEIALKRLRKECYERAAEVCEQLADRYHKPMNLAARNAAHAQLECAAAIREADAQLECAAAIRALIAEEKK